MRQGIKAVMTNFYQSVNYSISYSYDIVTQIMQATTLQNVKRARGIDIDVIDKGGTLHNISRQQMAEARKIKKYISQLTIAKTECEVALRKLGWDGAFPTVESDKVL